MAQSVLFWYFNVNGLIDHKSMVVGIGSIKCNSYGCRMCKGVKGDVQPSLPIIEQHFCIFILLPHVTVRFRAVKLVKRMDLS